MIIIKNKKCKIENILREYPNAVILDVVQANCLNTLRHGIGLLCAPM